MHSNHSPFHPHCFLALYSFLFFLYFTSDLTLSNNAYWHLATIHMTSVYSLIHPHLSFPLYAYTLYSVSITSIFKFASMIWDLIACIYLSLSFYLLRRASTLIRFFSLFSFSLCVLYHSYPIYNGRMEGNGICSQLS